MAAASAAGTNPGWNRRLGEDGGRASIFVDLPLSSFRDSVGPGTQLFASPQDTPRLGRPDRQRTRPSRSPRSAGSVEPPRVPTFAPRPHPRIWLLVSGAQ